MVIATQSNNNYIMFSAHYYLFYGDFDSHLDILAPGDRSYEGFCRFKGAVVFYVGYIF